MLLSKIFALVSLASTALASGDTITAAMGTISSTTTELETTVSGWNGKPLGTLPIIIKSTKLLIDIKSGTTTAEDSAVLSLGEALQVAQATNSLAAVVEPALDTIVAAKPKFDALLLGPIILLNLELQKKATEDFSSAVVEKVPEALQAVAEALVQPILDAFDAAIDAYAL
ncbi:hypothetical protein G7Z17_g8985 [Cylindrodendrum hubeiense]|uniref:Antigenic cell wall galactomannoprotein n=1 Tax=Cylindrodendrum hubeiense TaxID=595255 RepID=A0A9P5LDS8_9HYPO|nr:hypothetical protein G7Z17_g8985 [Cylindrodendrum hubeiense]